MSGPVVLAALAALSPDPIEALRTMLQADFMRAAFLVGTVTALAAGLAGYFVVLRRVAFAGDALSHFAFTGSLGALVAGLNPLLGLFGTTALAGLGMGMLGQRARGRDVAIGTTLAWVLGLGVLFLSLHTARGSGANSTVGVNILFGSILGLTEPQVRLSVAVGLAMILVLLAIARPLLFASLDPDVAAARGVPVRGLGAGFLLLMGITVAEAVPAVGALLVFALLVTPAAIAQRLVARPYAALAVSGALALAFTWLGLILAFFLPLPVSSVISTLAFSAYVAVLVAQRRTAPTRRLAPIR